MQNSVGARPVCLYDNQTSRHYFSNFQYPRRHDAIICQPRGLVVYPWCPRRLVSPIPLWPVPDTRLFLRPLDHNPTPPLHRIRKRTRRTYGHPSYNHENTWYVLYNHRLEHRGLERCVTRARNVTGSVISTLKAPVLVQIQSMHAFD